MIRLLIDVNNISQVLEVYNQIKVYRSTSETGVYAEITGPGTRIDIIPENDKYFYEDLTGTTNFWYKTSYYNSDTSVESDLSDPRRGGTEADKVGWYFDNYIPEPGEWGRVLTADDMRYGYLFGVDCIAADIAESSWTDEQFNYIVEEAMADFEKYLEIDIRKRIYKTNPSGSLIRGRIWRNGVDYTDIEDAYSYDPMQWQNFGFMQLRHAPVISVERAVLYSQVRGEVINLLDKGWLRINHAVGQIHMFPTTGMAYGPFVMNVLPWRLLGGRFPQGFEFDYTTGYITAEFLPLDLRSIIGKWAAVKALAQIGDGLLAGFSSQSVSLDGLSESFSSTQSATSAYFGARIVEYQKEIADWLQRNRHKYGAIPMSFVGY